MKEIKYKAIVLSCIGLSAPFILLAQQADKTVPVNKGFSIDVNWILISIAIILLLPIYLNSKTLLLTLNDKIKREKSDSNSMKNIGIIIFLLCLSQLSQAQTQVQAQTPSHSNIDWFTWTIAGVILLEVFLIVFLSTLTNKYLKPAKLYTESSSVSVSPKAWLLNIWNKINSFKPLSQEADIDTGHDYDGIRELDNITPPWFTTGFILTIIFAGVYLYRYHVAKSAPLPREEFNIEMAQAEEAKSKLLMSQANNIDESTVKMLGASDIAEGKTLFIATCTPCHGTNGGSKPGGVGPNLTDEYWIHGGSVKDIFKTIKYGWPEKGMISWKDNFSPKQIAQLASFVKSLKGTNPTGAKEPQGEPFKEESIVSNTGTKDSTTVNK